jgi:hypothetical protein
VVDQTTVRTHDGFYLRMGFGVGYGSVKSELDEPALEGNYSGGGWLLDLLLGGTIANTVVVGGGFVFHAISDPEVELNGAAAELGVDDTDTALGIGNLGLFVDVFFGPNSGGHVGGMIGAASIGLEDENGEPSSGLGLAVFGGYDFWVSDQWALGVNARYMYATAEREFVNYTFEDTAHTFGVLFSALYN